MSTTNTGENERMSRIENCKEKVQSCVKTGGFSKLRHVLALKAPQDSGKTTILKMVIEKLYDRDPKTWMGTGQKRFKKFDRSRVTNYSVANAVSGEYCGVFSIDGVLVVVSTVGDYTNYIVGNFKVFASAKAVIGVTAVREGNIAEVAYDVFCAELGFEATVIQLSGRYCGSKFEKEERIEADRIVERILALVGEFVV